MTKLTDMITVFVAAGWDVDNALVEYGGHAGKLATKAAEDGYDLIIAHGGDGTISEVVNAVMNTKGHDCIVAALPGGTANQWAHEIGIPVDPLKAALTLVNSEARKIDIGHIEVHKLIFPDTAHTAQSKDEYKKSKKKKAKTSHHFLLTAGLGVDAAVIGHTSKTLKERIGQLAFDVAAAKELPSQHSYPAEIYTYDDNDEQAEKPLWHGQALELVIGNTRRYADVVELTPRAYIDDGLLDLCIINKGSILESVQQVASLALRHEPDKASSEYYQAAHFSATLPASISLQLDGSAMELNDCLTDAEQERLKLEDASRVQVMYHFDVLPHALQVAIPRTYDNTLFVSSPSNDQSQHELDGASKEYPPGTQATQKIAPEQVQHLVEDGHQINVVGTIPNPDKQHTFIIAGSKRKQSTGDIKPVAVCVNDETLVYKRTGEFVASSLVETVQEGAIIIVEGKENKRGVIQAKHVII